MFTTLLESRANRDHSVTGGIASISAHAAVIGIAVIATARAHPGVREPREVLRMAVFVPQQMTAPVKKAAAQHQKVSFPALPPIDLKRLDVELPPIDVSRVPATPIDLPSRPTEITGASGRSAGEGARADVPFEAAQVEKQASFIAGSGAPRYPDALRSSGIQGKVVARFVVDERGMAEADSVQFVSSDNRLFEDAVRVALRRMRFAPAEIGGRKVRQLVQMPFVFTLGR